MRHYLIQSVSDSILTGPCDHKREVLWDKRPYTVAFIRSASTRLADRLSNAGADTTTLVGACLPHGLDYVVTLLATRSLGCVCVLINNRATDVEVNHILRDAGLCTVVTNEEGLSREVFRSWRPADDTEPAIVVRDAVADDARAMPPDARVVIYTAGTTGLPKGVILSEQGISANAWAVVEYLGLSMSDRTVVYTPAGYVYALSQTLTHLAVRALQFAYPHGMRFPRDLLNRFSAANVTGVATNPTGLRIMTDPSLGQTDPMTGVRYVMTGGQPLSLELLRRTRRLFPRASVINTYGCTETSARISCWVCPTDASGYTGALPVGYPITGTRIQVVDGTDQPVGDATPGEVVVRGPTLMTGYLGHPSATAECLRNGWFHTRDYGRYSDQNGLTLLGRLDDVIMVGHEKVGPEEVELVLEAVPGVKEAAVVAVGNELTDNMVGALLVTAMEANEVTQRCQEACATFLSAPKRPKQYRFTTTLPRNLYGKLDRRVARQLWEELGDDI